MADVTSGSFALPWSPRSSRALLCLLVASIPSGCAHGHAARRPPWPTAIREYVIPDTTAFPNDLAVDAEGIVWYTDRLGSRIGRLDPESGDFQQYPTPTPHSAPYGITIDAMGQIWYAASRAGLIGRMDPTTRTIREFPIAGSAGGPHSLVSVEGRVWFTMRRSNRYGWLDPDTGAARLYPFPLPEGVRHFEPGPYNLTATPDGSLWFTAMGLGALFQIDPTDGALSSVPLPDGGWPRRITADRGNAVWYTNFPRSRVGRLDPRSRRIDELPLLRAPAEPYGIAADPDGRIWFNEARNGLIVGYDPVARVHRALKIPTEGATVRGMVVDAKRRRVWLPLSGTHRIGRIDLPQ